MQTIQIPATTNATPKGVLEPTEGLGAVSVASTVDDAPIIVTVPSEVWATRLALKAEIAAREKAVKALDESIGFPDAAKVGKAAQIIIVNGNGLEIGKGIIYWFGGSVTPPAWRRRIS
jgi:hypothetical protein